MINVCRIEEENMSRQISDHELSVAEESGKKFTHENFP